MELLTFGQNTLVTINLDQLEDITSLKKQLSIDDEVTAYASDDNELAHIEYDEDNQRLILIYNVIHQEKIDQTYDTSPVTFIVKQHQVIVLTTAKTDYIIGDLQQLLTYQDIHSVYDFLFTALVKISKHYVKLLDKLDREFTQVNRLMRQKTTKDRLLTLSDIEMTMMYLRSASKQNLLVLEQFEWHSIFKRLVAEEKELLDDAIVEAKQILEMTDLSVQTMGQLSSTYNNVLNNQLNDTMKILTGLSILLTVPDIITGFFGINVPLPDFLVHNNLGWLVVIGIVVLAWIVMSKILNWIFDLKL